MVKIYKTQSEVEADIKDDVLVVQGDVKFECSISISASIKVVNGNIDAGNINARDIDAGNINARNIDAGNINARDINARDINARDINARDIDAGNINARNIDAGNINAWDINAWDIDAWDIDAGNINAWDINAWDIDAGNILYYAFCGVYNSIKCLSIKAKREVHSEPVYLDGSLEIKKPKEELNLSGKEVEVKIDGKTYTAIVK